MPSENCLENVRVYSAMIGGVMGAGALAMAIVFFIKLGQYNADKGRIGWALTDCTVVNAEVVRGYKGSENCEVNARVTTATGCVGTSEYINYYPIEFGANGEPLDYDTNDADDSCAYYNSGNPLPCFVDPGNACAFGWSDGPPGGAKPLVLFGSLFGVMFLIFVVGMVIYMGCNKRKGGNFCQ